MESKRGAAALFAGRSSDSFLHLCFPHAFRGDTMSQVQLRCGK